MRLLAIAASALCGITAFADDTRAFLDRPDPARWAEATPDEGVFARLDAVPGAPAMRFLRRSGRGELLAEIALFLDVPDRRPFYFPWPDRAIEPLPPRGDGMLGVEGAMRSAVSRAGLGAPCAPRGWEERTRWATLVALEAHAAGFPRLTFWRVGVVHLKMHSGRNALVVYRIRAGRRLSRTWQELRALLRSVHPVRLL